MYKTILKSVWLFPLFVIAIFVSSCTSDTNEPLTSSAVGGEIPRLRTLGETYTTGSYNEVVEILLESYQLECVCGTSAKTHKKLTIHGEWTCGYSSQASFKPIFRFEVPEGCTCRNWLDFRTGIDQIAATSTHKTFRTRNLIVMASSIATVNGVVKRSSIGEKFFTSTIQINLNTGYKNLTATENDGWGQPEYMSN